MDRKTYVTPYTFIILTVMVYPVNVPPSKIFMEFRQV